MTTELLFDKGYRCHRCGVMLYDGYPFTVCDDCWPHRHENTMRTGPNPDWWINRKDEGTA